MIQTIHNVPWLSQKGRDADASGPDCGPACMAMLIRHFTNERPTVNAITQMMHLIGDYATTLDFALLARRFGLRCRNHGQFDATNGPLTLDVMREALAAGRIPVALVNYQVLHPAYDFCHWVVVVGWGDGWFQLHDPWPELADKGAYVQVEATTLHEAMLATVLRGYQSEHGVVVWRE